ncbi:GMC oxidoreductase-domain-containing protein [Xylariaceae sp. FL0804]|nr:GMC oxidoreductase-domain-containing protein [Xylariaceae sp. FL0804]
MPFVLRLRDGAGPDHHLLRAGPEQQAARAAYNNAQQPRRRGGPYASGLLEVGDYMTVIVDLLRPLSRSGVVALYFKNGLDLLAMREGVRGIYDLVVNGEGMHDLVTGEYPWPMPVTSEYPWPMPVTSEEALDPQILRRSQTGFRPCGSTRLGKDIQQGVVDGQLKVHGVENLRVIGASVIQVIPDCRIQMAVYMIAEKGADMVKAAHPGLYS